MAVGMASSWGFWEGAASFLHESSQGPFKPLGQGLSSPWLLPKGDSGEAGS